MYDRVEKHELDNFVKNYLILVLSKGNINFKFIFKEPFNLNKYQ